jgi:hypothetical protein
VPNIVAGGELNSAETEDSPVASLSDKERRVLNLLALNSDGCEETVLLTGGVTAGHLAGLVLDGLATMWATLTPVYGREKSTTWMKITAAGRKAIAD